MGCDIHTNVEVKSNGKWTQVDKLVEDPYGPADGDVSYPTLALIVIEPIYDSRNYTVFGLLAGIRGNVTPVKSPRGIPEDTSDTIRESWELYAGHTSHYYTLAELETINRRNKKAYVAETADFFSTVLPKLKSIQEEHKVTTKEVRLVFWFDS
jgi:hypothetical protein